MVVSAGTEITYLILKNAQNTYLNLGQIQRRQHSFNIYKTKKSNLLDNGFPEIWDKNFINIHNCIICSSVLMEKEILDKEALELVNTAYNDAKTLLMKHKDKMDIIIDELMNSYTLYGKDIKNIME